MEEEVNLVKLIGQLSRVFVSKSEWIDDLRTLEKWLKNMLEEEMNKVTLKNHYISGKDMMIGVLFDIKYALEEKNTLLKINYLVRARESLFCVYRGSATYQTDADFPAVRVESVEPYLNELTKKI